MLLHSHGLMASNFCLVKAVPDTVPRTNSMVVKRQTRTVELQFNGYTVRRGAVSRQAIEHSVHRGGKPDTEKRHICPWPDTSTAVCS